MRIDRINLSRYGIFTDHFIDFGDRPDSGPDLHLVYGPNESGKSTSFAAFLDLLFGIETRSRYGFLHDYPSMRIGALLTIGGVQREFVRVKRAKNSLLDGKEQPISESVILGDLGGIDRASYETMFSLNDDTLEAGGESILASKGDLGQLLFSASAGLSELSQHLSDMRRETEGFYKARARSGELLALKQRLKELKDERDAIDIAALEFARLVDARNRASTAYGEALSESGRAQAHIESLQRQLGALPHLARLATLRTNYSAYSQIPDAPLGWADEIGELRRDDISLDSRIRTRQEDITAIEAELNAIEVDQPILDLAGEIEVLRELQMRHAGAEKDLPKLRFQRTDAKSSVAGLLGALDCDADTDPTEILLNAETLGSFRSLIEIRSGIGSVLDTTVRELVDAQDSLDEVLAQTGETSVPAPKAVLQEVPLAQLIAAVAAVRESDHAARLKIAEQDCEELKGDLARHLVSLKPWSGKIDQLQNMPTPTSSQLETWREAVAKAVSALDRYDDQIDTFEADLRRTDAELDAISNATGLVTENEAADIRTAREAAWVEHKHALDIISAETFEAALRRDDRVMAVSLRHATDAALITQLHQKIAGLTEDLETAQTRRQKVLDHQAEILQQISAAVCAVSDDLPDCMQIKQLSDWLDERRAALEVHNDIQKQVSKIEAAERDAALVCKRVKEVLTVAGIKQGMSDDLGDLLIVAQAVIDQQGAARLRKEKIAAARKAIEIRTRRQSDAKDAEVVWQRQWADLCGSCWLAERKSLPDVAAMGEILTVLEKLAPLAERLRGLDDRIEKMERDQQEYSKVVTAIAASLGMDASGSVTGLSAGILRRLGDAEKALVDRGFIRARLETARSDLRDIAGRKDVVERRKTDMLNHFKVETLDDVDNRLRDLDKRQDLAAEIADLEGDICLTFDTISAAEAEALLADLDRATTEVEIAEERGRLDDLTVRKEGLFAEFSKASDRVEAVGGDSRVARLEEARATVLLEIEEGAASYLRLRLGIVAAEHALRLYREQHRSAMMTRASDAFVSISRGAYRGLATQPFQDSEVLVALGADDSSKLASEMSKGTRFQLYLALRVAGYFEFSQRRQPVPFVSDDILETFDEGRAEETLRIFSDMAQIGQVIYLTHHRHLCGIAKRVCPDVKIHELPARSV